MIPNGCGQEATAATEHPRQYRSIMVTKYLPKAETETIVTNTRNLYDHLIGGGVADLRRMPSTIIHESANCTVHRYQPTREADPGALPTLLVPPMAATSVCFDLRRGCSLVEYLLDQGRPVYLVDYGDISSLRDQDLGLEHWIDSVIPTAVEVSSVDSGDLGVQLVGWCLGGILSMFTEAAHPDLPIMSVATVASPFDFSQVRVLEPVRFMEGITGGAVTTGLLRIMGGVPGKANSLIFKWLDPSKQLKKPLLVLRNRGDREVLAQIEAVDVLMDTMEAYPGRSIAQIYHTFIRTNHLSAGHMRLRGGRVVELADVHVPVMNVAGVGDLFFAPPASAHRLGELLPNAPSVRLETAPGGHLGVLSGRAARGTTWRYLTEFLDAVDTGAAAGTR
jgi:polyhydroxyalkanoate synthase subunit PhaC